MRPGPRRDADLHHHQTLFSPWLELCSPRQAQGISCLNQCWAHGSSAESGASDALVIRKGESEITSIPIPASSEKECPNSTHEFWSSVFLAASICLVFQLDHPERGSGGPGRRRAAWLILHWTAKIGIDPGQPICCHRDGSKAGYRFKYRRAIYFSSRR